MKSKRTPSPLAKKILKIKAALELLEINLSDEHKLVVNKLVNLCRIGPDLSEELNTHAGVYAYLAENAQILQRQIEDLEAALSGTRIWIEDEYNVIISMLRDAGVKLTVDQKKEVLSLVRQDELTQSQYYQEIDDEDVIKRLSEILLSNFSHRQGAEEFEKSLREARMQKNLLDQIISAIAYQKNMALRALVDLETIGVRQEMR